jgi:transposase-like protein
MAAKRTQWTRAHARRVIDDLERSGLTVTAFARSRNLHPKRIREWRRRFEQEAAVEAPRMVELVADALPVPCSLKLSCPSGHVIEVTGVELTDGVRAMLAALPEPKTC